MPEQDVAHSAADERDVLAPAGLRQQLRPARQAGQAVQHPLGALQRVHGAHAASRTGIPAAARCALACAIVNVP